MRFPARKLLPGAALGAIALVAAGLAADAGGNAAARPPSEPCGVRRPYWPTSAWRRSPPAAQGMDADTLAAALARIEATLPEVYSFLVVRHGFVVAERYWNGHDAESVFEIASATKSVTGALVGIALADGTLRSVDQRVAELLPEYFAPADPLKETITLRQLLMMTGGFGWAEMPGLSDWTSSRDWIAFTLALPLSDPPGTRFNYQTGGSHILSTIVARASGMSALAFANERLFAPLGFRVPESRWGTDPEGNTTGGFGLRLTAREMAKFGWLYLNDGCWDGRRLVPRKWVRDSTAPRVAAGPPENARSYGYQWWVEEYRGHTVPFASGYGGQYILLVPDLDLVIVSTANPHRSPGSFRAGRDLVRDYVIPAVRDR